MDNIFRSLREHGNEFLKSFPWIKRVAKRSIVHCFSFVASIMLVPFQAMAMYESIMFVILCYIGFTFLFPEKITWKTTGIGIGMAFIWAAFGIPLYLIPFPAGMVAWLQKIVTEPVRPFLRRIILYSLFLVAVGIFHLLLTDIPYDGFLFMSSAIIPPIMTGIAVRLLTGSKKDLLPDSVSSNQSIPSFSAVPENWLDLHLASIRQLRESSEKLSSPARETVAGIASQAEKITEAMKSDPRDIDPGHKFLMQYLPAAQSIADNLYAFSGDGIQKKRLDNVLAESQTLLQRLEQAFETQHTQLLVNDIRDMEVELGVLDKMLRIKGH